MSCGTTLSDNYIRNWRLHKVGRKEKENIFEEIIVGNFPNLIKILNIQTQESQGATSHET